MKGSQSHHLATIQEATDAPLLLQETLNITATAAMFKPRVRLVARLVAEQHGVVARLGDDQVGCRVLRRTPLTVFSLISRRSSRCHAHNVG